MTGDFGAGQKNLFLKIIGVSVVRHGDTGRNT